MNKEEIILSLVTAGELEIDAEGQIWRLKKRHGKPRQKGESDYQKRVGLTDCKRVRAEYPTRDGYLLITTTINGVKTVTGAHRVIWTYFNGPIPDGLTINHKHEDGNKQRNHPDNLELATYSEQRRHAIEVLNVNRNRPKGSKHPKTHLTEADVLLMRQMRKAGAMVKDIAEKYQMKPRAVSAICTGRTWPHV
jgi:hypothetical protein